MSIRDVTLPVSFGRSMRPELRGEVSGIDPGLWHTGEYLPCHAQEGASRLVEKSSD
jgi:hypothetical protein